jgi:hypothetical protein
MSVYIDPRSCVQSPHTVFDRHLKIAQKNQMGLGILEPLVGGNVPGTVLLDQNAAHSEETTNRLRHGTGKNAHIVLAPQPFELAALEEKLSVLDHCFWSYDSWSHSR